MRYPAEVPFTVEELRLIGFQFYRLLRIIPAASDTLWTIECQCVVCEAYRRHAECNGVAAHTAHHTV